jgi:hypothetical protein
MQLKPGYAEGQPILVHRYGSHPRGQSAFVVLHGDLRGLLGAEVSHELLFHRGKKIPNIPLHLIEDMILRTVMAISVEVRRGSRQADVRWIRDAINNVGDPKILDFRRTKHHPGQIGKATAPEHDRGSDESH